MIRKHFNDVVFDGKALSDFGVHVSGEGVFTTPEKVFETVEVPGRHGDLLIDTGRFENVSVKYPAFIFDDFKTNMRALRGYLLSRGGYRKLEDSYHPDEYRMAYYKEAFDPEVTLLQAGTFDLTFECKPQRFLKNGSDWTYDFTATTKIVNPTYFEATPLIRIYGNGTLTVGSGGHIVVAGNSAQYLDVDCDTMDAFYGSTNKNSNVTYSLVSGHSGVFIPSGEQTIGLGSGITRVRIVPRWWTI